MLKRNSRQIGANIAAEGSPNQGRTGGDAAADLLQQRRRRRAVMLELGVKQTAIAREAGVSTALVGQVLDGTRKSPRVLDALQKYLGASQMRALGFPETATPRTLAASGESDRENV